ncbi:iron ABC transporter permease [Paenibacillus sp. J22TS3]|uniref:FecCD family ABC transporter permease n=1 Tax=Paenibacillus sp. J22TS3 TaxID=2807192 RepID=UPI001B04DE4F|nr:iron ABC transporter permease [Paenibacillus sp. J22TS3]GIP21669.1 iron ABC transporter permease [Paenibacillus sp. J22TS3]
MKKVVLSQGEKNRHTRAIWVMAVFAILIAVMFLISMNLGQIRLTPTEVFRTVAGQGTAKQELILFEFRLPEIIISILVGAGLALSGCLLQGVTGNALAEPGILGINSGAGLAVLVFVYFYPEELLGSVYLMPVLALAGAAAAAVLIYSLAYKKGQGMSAMRLVLGGIGTAAGINALTLVLSLRLDPQSHQLIYTWLAGSIRGTDWTYVAAFLPWLIILIPYALYQARVLNILTLGDSSAIGLGTSVNRARFRIMALAVALAGACVAVGGAISFVGLICPHLARRLVGPKHQLLIPASMLCGALLMLVADAVTRWIAGSASLPVGVVVAVIGAPYFLYLLAKSRS